MRHRFNPWGGEDFLEKEMQPIAGFLPEKSYGERSLAGYSPWGSKRVGHNRATEHTLRE